MHNIEIFPLGLDSPTILRSENEQLSWHNITTYVDFTCTLSASQDTYQQRENSTYYQRVSNDWQAGHYIENEAYGEFLVDNLIWHLTDRTFVLENDLGAESPLNITAAAPNIISNNITIARNIASLLLTTQKIISDISGKVSYTDVYQGSVVARNLGNSSIPIYNLDVVGTAFILLGNNWIYKIDAEIFSNVNDNLAIHSFNQSLCSIDTSHMKEFTGHEINFKAYGDQCISLGGRFFIENTLDLVAHDIQQTGLLISNGDIAINAHKINITGEVIANGISLKGSEEVLFDVGSTVRSNSYIGIADYQSIIFKGKVEATNKINISSNLFIQDAEASITTVSFEFKGDTLKLCGIVNIQELKAQGKLVEFCSTAQGKIKFVTVNTLEFRQNSNITISNLNVISANKVSFLTEAPYNLQILGTVLDSLILDTTQLDYQGMICATNNITVNLIGDHLLHNEIRAEQIYFNIAGILTNNAIFVAMNSTLIATSFINEKAGKVKIDNTASFTLKEAMHLNPNSIMNLGAIKVMSPDQKEIDTLLCKGCRLIVRGTEESVILTNNLINQIEFYKKEETTSCGREDYPRWICHHIKNGFFRKATGNGPYENKYCIGSSYCDEEHHSYGIKGVIVINGKLNLGATNIIFELSDNFFKELNLINPPVAPTITSNHINKIVYVRHDVLSATLPLMKCEDLAAFYRISGTPCLPWETGYILTKAIDEVSATFIAEKIDGEIEGGILINWRKQVTTNQISEITTRLVSVEYFKKLESRYYMSPDILVNKHDITNKFFKNALRVNFKKLFATQSQMNQPLLTDGSELGLSVRPILMSSGFTIQCSDKVGQDQLDCAQYTFLKELGFKGNINTQFDFTTWKDQQDPSI